MRSTSPSWALPLGLPGTSRSGGGSVKVAFDVIVVVCLILCGSGVLHMWMLCVCMSLLYLPHAQAMVSKTAS